MNTFNEKDPRIKKKDSILSVKSKLWLKREETSRLQHTRCYKLIGTFNSVQKIEYRFEIIITVISIIQISKVCSGQNSSIQFSTFS